MDVGSINPKEWFNPQKKTFCVFGPFAAKFSNFGLSRQNVATKRKLMHDRNNHSFFFKKKIFKAKYFDRNGMVGPRYRGRQELHKDVAKPKN